MVPQFTRKCCYGASKKLVSTGRSPLSILARIASGSVASMRQMHFSPSRTRRGGTGAESDHVRPVRARRPSVVSSPTVKVRPVVRRGRSGPHRWYSYVSIMARDRAERSALERREDRRCEQLPPPCDASRQRGRPHAAVRIASGGDGM